MKTKLMVVIAVLVLSLVKVLGQVASVKFSQQGPKLIGSDAVGDSRQGYSVALSADGSTAVVGGGYDDNGIGAVWIWTRNAGVWTQQGPKLVGSGAVGPAKQGLAVALSADGNTAIVGGGVDDNGIGAVWIWTRNAGVWTQQGPKLVGSGALGKAMQGSSVSISADGNTAIVGGPSDNRRVNSTDTIGAVWIWTRNAGVWTQQAKLVGNDDGFGGNSQGFSVSISAEGDTAIVGGPRDWPQGSARIWVRSGKTWVERGSLAGSVPRGDLYGQGFSVSISAEGDTAMIGRWSDVASWVFTRKTGLWTQQGSRLIGTEVFPLADGKTSVSLSADGNTAIVAASAQGAAWVWKRNQGIWTQQGPKLVGSGASPCYIARFTGGISTVSVSADGTTFILGEPCNNGAWIFSSSPEWRQLIEKQPAQPVYAQLPEREAGKDSLVVVTHGWIPKKDGQTSPPDPVWVDEMVEAIRSNLKTRGLNNWQVEGFKWKEKAWLTKAGVVSDEILNNAEKEGGSLGHFLASQGYARVHLIGHSAGAAAIQYSALILKSANVNTVVHTTFLDPYVGVRYGGKKKYGLAANWADNYFAWDPTTRDHLFFGRTASKLDRAYNVDVGSLDASKVSLGRYRSTGNGQVEECFETVTSHEWPHEFYFKTINQSWPEAEGFGFALSQEGGNWDFALANYSNYKDSTRELGIPDLPCPLGQNLSTPVFPSWVVDFNQTTVVTSPTGLIKNNGSGLVLASGGQPQQRSLSAATTSESVWVATSIVATNPVNLISFDVEFSSVKAEGLLTVYWETNVVGSIDERVVAPGLQHYSYALPMVYTNGPYTLGLRLDSFSGVTSSVVITNASFSFTGIPSTFGLSFLGRNNGISLLKLTGPAGFSYSVEASTNLTEWQPIAILVNTNGAVSFTDRQSTNLTARFYRAVGY